MIKRGGIYLVNLNPIKGREQAGRRPVLVISSDAINKQLSVVVGIDARNVTRDYPTQVLDVRTPRVFLSSQKPRINRTGNLGFCFRRPPSWQKN